MKKIAFSFLLCIFAMKISAQEKILKTHIAESKNLVGLWQMVGELKINDVVRYLPTTFFKIYNQDGTFANIKIPQNIPPRITAYGTYVQPSEGKISEYIIASFDPISNTTTILEYELEKNGLLLSIRYKLANQDEWKSEKWMRVIHKTEEMPKVQEKQNVF